MRSREMQDRGIEIRSSHLTRTHKPLRDYKIYNIQLEMRSHTQVRSRTNKKHIVCRGIMLTPNHRGLHLEVLIPKSFRSVRLGSKLLNPK